MNLSVIKKYRVQVNKILWITLFWTCYAIFNFFSIWSTLIENNCTPGPVNASTFLYINIATGILAGLVGGTLIVFLWERWLRRLSYNLALFNIWWSYTMTYIVISILMSLTYKSQLLQLPVYDSMVITAAIEQQLLPSHIHIYVEWLIIVLGTLLFLQINDKYGPGNFTDFIKGKYFHPQREERIFMFLDLRSSTFIAEKLGEAKYFQLLQDLFRIATPGIISQKGEIYQYVGDEIVISWETSVGLSHARCINCYFQIKNSLEAKTGYFQKTYGIIPEFKAGLHLGFVMAGEIGVIKKDIAYSGDVLNTTSRIQEKCNELGVDILISENLESKIEKQFLPEIPKIIGDIVLRGKGQKVKLYTI